MGRDSGYPGQLKSLAGVLGREGSGIEVNSYGVWASTEFPANPNRVWLLMTNIGVGITYVGFADAPAAGSLQLDVGQTLQIDVNLPWTGGFIFSSTGVLNMSIQEAQLAGV